ncbi:MAG TPA: DUF2325 domain-containing protein [Thiotrichaceae bacterium]|nr:DUF2325 domain-containing protein [Thiotrichaceae bacterium]
MNTLQQKLIRTPLHKLHHRYGCSIVGTCVTLSEINKIRKKAKLYPTTQLSDYDLHRLFVEITGERCYANRRLQKLLDTKYKMIINEFMATRDPEEITKLWHKHCKSGALAGAYWAILTHPNTSEELCTNAYGEVHMLSHLHGVSTRLETDDLKILKVKYTHLKQQQEASFRKNQKSLYEKDKVINQQKNKLLKLQQEINALKASQQPKQIAHQEESFTFVNSTIDRKIAYLEDKNQQLQEQVQLLSDENHQLRNNLSQLHNAQYEVSQPTMTTCASAEYCQQHDLKGRCILYVGGRDKQCSHFKQIVHDKNGHFIHHDGGKDDGTQKLNSSLTKADTVMCPLDCISHEAMNIIKRYCKKEHKRLVLMPRSSLAAFEKGLSILDKQVDLNPTH